MNFLSRINHLRHFLLKKVHGTAGQGEGKTAELKGNTSAPYTFHKEQKGNALQAAGKIHEVKGTALHREGMLREQKGKALQVRGKVVQMTGISTHYAGKILQMNGKTAGKAAALHGLSGLLLRIRMALPAHRIRDGPA